MGLCWNSSYGDDGKHDVYGRFRRARFRSFNVDLHSSWDISARNVAVRVH